MILEVVNILMPFRDRFRAHTRARRVKVKLPCRVSLIGSIMPPYLFDVANLSETGLYIVARNSKHCFRKASLVNIEIITPRETILCTAVPARFIGSKEMGMKISMIDDSNARLLHNYIRSLIN